MSKKQFQEDFFNTDKYACREFDPKETLKWVKRDIIVFMSWGVSRFLNLDNKGLLLSVNGWKHKGYVLITLAWDDTYTVRFFNTWYNETKPKKEMVYCDVLYEAIDDVIEKH